MGQHSGGGAPALHSFLPRQVYSKCRKQILEKKNCTFTFEQSKLESVKINFFLEK